MTLSLFRSIVLNQHLGLEGLRASLGKILPSVLRIVVHHGAEVAPEGASAGFLTTRGRHVHLRTLEGLRHATLFLSNDLGLELSTGFSLFTDSGLISGLGRVGTFGTKEAVHVVSKDVGIGQHDVHGSTLFRSSVQHGVHGGVTTNLLDQGVFHCTGVVVKQGGGFSTEVLKDFQRDVRDLTQVGINCGGGSGLILSGLFSLKLGQIRRLLGRISWG